jgi:hypothetical protein
VVTEQICGSLQVSLGGGLYQHEAIRDFILCIENNPPWFLQGLHIESVFDSFSALLWNGGRKRPLDDQVTMANMVERVEFFNSRKLGVNFTFTNSQLSSEHIKDRLCNEVLRRFENPLNGIIINSDILEKHIRQTCPQYKIIFSLTKVEYDKNKLLKATTDYDLVVIPPEYNRDIDFLQQLPPEKIVLCINEMCFPFCPDRKSHYDKTAKEILLGQKIVSRPIFCHNKKKYGEMCLSIPEMRQIAIKTGINRVKFLFARSGVDDLFLAYEGIAAVFVKPEFCSDFVNAILDIK